MAMEQARSSGDAQRWRCEVMRWQSERVGEGMGKTRRDYEAGQDGWWHGNGMANPVAAGVRNCGA